MASLNMSKVAVGCGDLAALRQRLDARIADGTTWIVTRFRPKRAEELIGGSLYWIVKHRFIARQTIIGFEDTEEGRIRIRLDGGLVEVRPQPKRAHQGWRYLAEGDAPADLLSGGDMEALPPPLAAALAELALI